MHCEALNAKISAKGQFLERQGWSATSPVYSTTPEHPNCSPSGHPGIIVVTGLVLAVASQPTYNTSDHLCSGQIPASPEQKQKTSLLSTSWPTMVCTVRRKWVTSDQDQDTENPGTCGSLIGLRTTHRLFLALLDRFSRTHLIHRSHSLCLFLLLGSCWNI